MRFRFLKEDDKGCGIVLRTYEYDGFVVKVILYDIGDKEYSVDYKGRFGPLITVLADKIIFSWDGIACQDGELSIMEETTKKLRNFCEVFAEEKEML